MHLKILYLYFKFQLKIWSWFNSITVQMLAAPRHNNMDYYRPWPLHPRCDTCNPLSEMKTGPVEPGGPRGSGARGDSWAMGASLPNFFTLNDRTKTSLVLVLLLPPAPSSFWTFRWSSRWLHCLTSVRPFRPRPFYCQPDQKFSSRLVPSHCKPSNEETLRCWAIQLSKTVEAPLSTYLLAT